jgi:hypothetical protein
LIAGTPADRMGDGPCAGLVAADVNEGRDPGVSPGIAISGRYIDVGADAG